MNKNGAKKPPARKVAKKWGWEKMEGIIDEERRYVPHAYACIHPHNNI
jgi:hypothetical protein